MSDGPAGLVGQSLMLSFEGTQASPELLQALTQTRACGVVLFAKNIASPAQLFQLTSALQAHAAAHGLPPLLIAIDQEGGVVSRLPEPFVTVPSQMAQAATGNPDSAYECARISGQQLRDCGVNTNFAPVLDINCNPRNPVIGTRAFGQDAATVTRFGTAAMRGYHDAGVIATIKHFPGHGDTHIDSHLDLPVVGHERDLLEQRELLPFKAAIAAGAPAVMSAHLHVPALDDQPATLSRRILTDLLRGELGFNGLVFTDALDMQAIAGRYGPSEAAIRAKQAGVDVLLPLGTLENQTVVAQALGAALQNGQLEAALFEATARRLAAVRTSYDLSHSPPAYQEPAAELRQAALAVARRGLTLLGGTELLPLPATTRLALIDFTQPRFSLAEEALERAALLRELVRQHFPHASAIALSSELQADEREQAERLAASSEVLLLVTRSAALRQSQLELARHLVSLGVPVVHAAVRLPYDAALLPNVAASLLTYGDPPVSLQALVEVIAGHARPEGRSPVELAGA